MCMYVCMYVCKCVCIYVCKCVCMYVCMYVCIYVCMYVFMYVCMDACMHACMYVCVCMSACVCVCLSVCLYVCIMCVLWCAPIYIIMCVVLSENMQMTQWIQMTQLHFPQTAQRNYHCDSTVQTVKMWNIVKLFVQVWHQGWHHCSAPADHLEHPFHGTWVSECARIIQNHPRSTWHGWGVDPSGLKYSGGSDSVATRPVIRTLFGTHVNLWRWKILDCCFFPDLELSVNLRCLHVFNFRMGNEMICPLQTHSTCAHPVGDNWGLHRALGVLRGGPPFFFLDLPVDFGSERHTVTSHDISDISHLASWWPGCVRHRLWDRDRAPVEALLGWSVQGPSRLHHGSITAPFVTIVCRIYPYIICPTVQAFVHFFPNILAYLSSSLCHPASYPIHLECLVPHSRLEDKQNCPWLPGWAVTTSCVCHPFTPHLILSSTDMPSLCARASTFHCALWVLKLPGSVKNHHPSPDPSCCQGTRALSISVKNTALQIQIVRTSWGISAAACRCTHPEWSHMLVMR